MSHKVPRLGLGGVRNSDGDIAGMERGNSMRGEQSPKSPDHRRGSASPAPKPTPVNRRQSASALPSPKSFKYETPKQGGSTPRRESKVVPPPDSMLAGSANECRQLEIFESQEVRELIAVGDKVWTAERRSPNVIIRNSITGKPDKVVTVPKRKEGEGSERSKEHVFPWSMLHVKFFVEDTTRRSAFDSPQYGDDSDNEDSRADNASMSRQSPVASPQPAGLSGRKSSTISLEGRPLKKRTSLVGSPLKRGLGARQDSMRKVGSSRSQAAPPSAFSIQSNASFRQDGQSPRGLPETPVTAHPKSFVDEVWVGYSDGTIRAFDSTTGEMLGEMKEQGGGIYCMTLYDCYIYSGSNDWTIRKWDATNRTIVGQFLPGKNGHSNSIRSVTIANGFLVSGSDDFTIRLWDHIYVGKSGPESGTGRCVRVLHGHKASVLTITYCDGRIWSGSEDATVMVWDISGERTTPIKQLTDTRHVVTKLIALPKISRVLCCSVDNVVRVYDAVNMVLVSNLSGHTGFVHSCAPVGMVQRYVVWSTSQDQTIRAWMVAGYDKMQSTSPLIGLDEDYERKRVKFLLRDAERMCEEMQKRLHDKELDEREKNRLIEQLQHDKARLEEELERLREQLDLHNRDRNRADAHAREVDDLRRQLQDLRDENQALREKDRELELERRKKESMSADQARMKNEIDRLAKELADARQGLRAAEAKNDAYKGQMDALRGNLDNINREKGAASSIAQLEEKSRKALKFEKELLEDQVRRLEADVVDLREGNKRKTIQLQAAEGHIHMYEELHRSIAPVLMQHEAMRRRTIRFDEYEADSAKVPGLVDEVEEYKEKLKEALAKLKERDSEVDELKYENSCMSPKGKKNEEIAEHIRQKNEMRDEILALRAEVEKLGRQIEELRGVIDEKDNTIEMLEKQNAENEARIKELEDEIARLKAELEAMKAAHDEAIERANALQEDADCWEERLRVLRDEVAAKTTRVQRAEDVLADLRRRNKELEDRVEELEKAKFALQSELEITGEQERAREDEMQRLADELLKLKGEQRDEFKFILQSRTDFIQAVYDWLLCSAMSRRYAKKLDMSNPSSKDALQQAVEGAYKRGHYILSNYVSEIEKHHLGVSPSLYPADPTLQQMFASRRADVTGFLRNVARNEPTTINRVDIVANSRDGAGADTGSARVRSPRRRPDTTGSASPQATARRTSGSGARSFTPPAAYRRAHSAADGGERLQSPRMASSRGNSPPTAGTSTVRSTSMGKKKSAGVRSRSQKDHELPLSPTRRAAAEATTADGKEFRSPQLRLKKEPSSSSNAAPRIFPNNADVGNLTFRRK